jgi:hypothetical protein
MTVNGPVWVPPPNNAPKKVNIQMTSFAYMIRNKLINTNQVASLQALLKRN